MFVSALTCVHAPSLWKSAYRWGVCLGVEQRVPANRCVLLCAGFPVVQACECVLPFPVSARFRADFVCVRDAARASAGPHVAVKLCTQAAGVAAPTPCLERTVATGSSETLEWDCLVHVMHTWAVACGVARPLPAVPKAPPAPAPQEVTGDAAWLALVESASQNPHAAAESVALGLPVLASTAVGATGATAASSVQLDLRCTTVEGMSPMLATLLGALHAVCEDCKLRAGMWGSSGLGRLLRLVSALAWALDRKDYVCAYLRVCGRVRPAFAPTAGTSATRARAPARSLPPPLSILGWCTRLCGAAPDTLAVAARLPAGVLTHTSSPTRTTALVVRLYQLLHAPGASRAQAAATVVLELAQAGVTAAGLEGMLPFGVALPLLDAVRSCRQQPPMNWPVAAYELVGRPDLARMRGGKVAAASQLGDIAAAAAVGAAGGDGSAAVGTGGGGGGGASADTATGTSDANGSSRADDPGVEYSAVGGDRCASHTHTPVLSPQTAVWPACSMLKPLDCALAVTGGCMKCAACFGPARHSCVACLLRLAGHPVPRTPHRLQHSKRP